MSGMHQPVKSPLVIRQLDQGDAESIFQFVRDSPDELDCFSHLFKHFDSAIKVQECLVYYVQQIRAKLSGAKIILGLYKDSKLVGMAGFGLDFDRNLAELAIYIHPDGRGGNSPDLARTLLAWHQQNISEFEVVASYLSQAAKGALRSLGIKVRSLDGEYYAAVKNK